jgi:hypothetical protein
MRKTPLAVALALFSSAAFAQVPQQPPIKEGFPLVLPGQGAVKGKPLLANLNFPGSVPGTQSIIFGTDKGFLHVIHQTSPTTWAEAPGFPVAVGAPILSSPAVGIVGEIAHLTELAIIVGYGDPLVPLGGGVKAFRRDGSLLWDRPSLDRDGDGRSDAVIGTPAIRNVDGFFGNEVVWGSLDHKVYLVTGSTGADQPNWPRDVLEGVVASPVLHDMDGDLRAEIIVGVPAHADATFGTPNGGCLHVLPWNQPAIGQSFPENVGYPQNLPGFPKCIDQVIYSDPVVGNIDGDSRPDIVHGTGDFYPGGTKQIYAWTCGGAAVPGWPVPVNGWTRRGQELALVNLDLLPNAGDVVVTVDTNQVYVIRANGTVRPGFPKTPLSFDGTTPNVGSPIVADVLGIDDRQQILVPTNTDVAVLSADGVQLTDGGSHTGSPSFYTATTLGNVAAANIDPNPNNFEIEVVAVSAAPFPTATDTVIHVWKLADRDTSSWWPQYRHTQQRFASYPGTGPCPKRVYGACPAPPSAPAFKTITPCRAVDTRGGAPIGGPPLSSGEMRDFVPRGLCNIPSTAKALSINVTVVSPTSSGYVRFSPSCQMPNASAINFSAGQTRANNAVLQLGNSDGVLTANAFLTGGGTVQLLIDVNGYFE